MTQFPPASSFGISRKGRLKEESDSSCGQLTHHIGADTGKEARAGCWQLSICACDRGTIIPFPVTPEEFSEIPAL